MALPRFSTRSGHCCLICPETARRPVVRLIYFFQQKNELFIHFVSYISGAPTPMNPALVRLLTSGAKPDGSLRMPGFVLSTFACDFGHIIRGSVNVQKFKFMNAGQVLTHVSVIHFVS